MKAVSTLQELNDSKMTLVVVFCPELYRLGIWNALIVGSYIGTLPLETMLNDGLMADLEGP